VKNTLQPLSQDFSNLIGIPYETLDCWGVAKEFYKIVFRYDLLDYYDHAPNDNEIAKDLIAKSKSDFEEVETPEYGDILLINLQGIPCHIAIYLSPSTILHTVKGSGCLVDRYSRWTKMVRSIHRVKR